MTRRAAFEHTGPNGTAFAAENIDLSGGVKAYVPPEARPTGNIGEQRATQQLLMQDVAALIGFHAVHIRPELNGFAGYDAVKFDIQY